jgi:phosphatidylserine decarboxylase
MLDSLGSTLSSQTINSFFTRFDRNPFEESITISQVVQCLESEICRPPSERKHVTSPPNEADTTPTTPRGVKLESPPQLDRIDFSGPSNVQPDENGRGLRPEPVTPQPTEEVNVPLQDVAADNRPGNSARQSSASSEDAGEESSSGGSEEARERVINIKNCPLCHRPRLRSKGEVDIVTHIALCASQDWGRMDKIVVGNFVTASQAQRKWYTKIIGKLSAGDYRLGAVSTPLLDVCFRRSLTIRVEFCEHYRSEPNDRTAGGGEDASVCEVGDQVTLQRGQVSDGRKQRYTVSNLPVPLVFGT